MFPRRPRCASDASATAWRAVTGEKRHAPEVFRAQLYTLATPSARLWEERDELQVARSRSKRPRMMRRRRETGLCSRLRKERGESESHPSQTILPGVYLVAQHRRRADPQLRHRQSF